MTVAERIKDLMRENPSITAGQIAKAVGLTVSGVQYRIKKMKASGEIERRGADYGGSWRVNG